VEGRTGNVGEAIARGLILDKVGRIGWWSDSRTEMWKRGPRAFNFLSGEEKKYKKKRHRLQTQLRSQGEPSMALETSKCRMVRDGLGEKGERIGKTVGRGAFKKSLHNSS